MFKTLNTLLLACLLIAPAVSAVQMKDYHKEIMTGDNGKIECAVCHGDVKRKTTPAASQCESCHGSSDDMALQTVRPKDAGHDVEPNPHDSLHYGTDLPCTYCHQEHKQSKVYCNECHKFEYLDMKR